MHRLVPAVVLVLASTSLAACSSHPSTPYERGVITALELAGEATDDSLRGQFAEQDTRTERDLWRLAGIDGATGESADTDLVFAAIQDELRSQVADPLPTEVEFKPASYSRSADGFGAGLFAGWASDTITFTTAAGNDPANSTGIHTVECSGASSQLTSEPNLVAATTHLQNTVDGVTMTVDTEHTMDPCPSEDNTVRVTSHIAVVTTAGDISTWIIVDVTTWVHVSGEADDVFDFTTESGSAGPDGERVVTVTYDGETGATSTALGWEPTGSTAQAIAFIGALTAATTAINARDAVQAAWDVPNRCG